MSYDYFMSIQQTKQNKKSEMSAKLVFPAHLEERSFCKNRELQKLFSPVQAMCTPRDAHLHAAVQLISRLADCVLYFWIDGSLPDISWHVISNLGHKFTK